MKELAPRPWGLSVRLKLALSYAGFLVVAGVGLFVVGFLLLRFVPEGNLVVDGGGSAPTRGDLLEVFVRYVWWAMGLLIVFGLVGGWTLAGIVLGPLQRITDAARRARDGELSQRLQLSGRRDELTDLADTLDSMLDRIEHTIDQERRFAANASHELRTPHAIIRTMVEVARADPEGRDVEKVLARIAATNDRAIASTEALLTLARIERGQSLMTSPVEFSAIVTRVVQERRRDAGGTRIELDVTSDDVLVTGNETLLAQMVTNLVGNAVTHNVADGWVRISVSGRALSVENSGEVLGDELVATLTEPFVRGAGRARQGVGDDGAGLGLAIVASIVQAHGGTLALTARPTGGLHVRVTLPR